MSNIRIVDLRGVNLVSRTRANRRALFLTRAAYSVTVVALVAPMVLFNVWLAADCKAGSGIITLHGKVCAIR